MEEKLKQRKGTVTMMARYQCRFCCYIYDPKLGNPSSRIKPGIPFEKLPDDWVCPDCGAVKTHFEKMK
jgi:rubredoxin